eukprot:CAMPEP_0202915386 /NCGR_PEP_ID=MMETSP1392-20130828/65554_1 /ASSEMBLY_ACC=CAM_ASM_000868 /TAXON_ID=225041 /ORGANISM="Chlamydomonas chlamydogama, Strain SAG 11-48b" /LENGTH=36 /DNA_ID= /DNA_START= /DNA_END= /DNA_ORIENTATION=
MREEHGLWTSKDDHLPTPANTSRPDVLLNGDTLPWP